MKNLLSKTFYVALFVLAGIVFQISCSNSDDSSLPAQTNKIVFYKGNATENGFYTSNYDGSGQTLIPVTLPSTIFLTTTTASPHLSPDGQKVFFVGIETATNSQNIYSFNIDGSGFQEIIDSESGIIALGNAN
ncbi:MAG: hypothetical protein EOO50_10140 [Flavobacterium sp.]|uniref:hypothetical protein n=1 Tax=Flavobacterium sp. TaxID=239 RepID=UPI001204AA33|nr:hypothetical protein [Flavobacterium sp.]RZJ66282.1 MAG: hypothetical protein EOO50_10140 [Flavobacterium sp.]